jgi:hypothetical protein
MQYSELYAATHLLRFQTTSAMDLCAGSVDPNRLSITHKFGRKGSKLYVGES